MRDLTTRGTRAAHALWEALADEAVGVLVRASLPGTRWVGEVDLDARLVREKLMLGHLFALVIGQGPRHRLGQGPHLPGEGLPDTRRILRLGTRRVVRVVRSTSVPSANMKRGRESLFVGSSRIKPDPVVLSTTPTSIAATFQMSFVSSTGADRVRPQTTGPTFSPPARNFGRSHRG